MRDLFQYERIVSQDKKAISRAISIVENDEFDYMAFLKLFASSRFDADVIGITGPPGVGKSTLISKLVNGLKGDSNSKGIGIIMVDPTSPISGGAILGDRVRLNDFVDQENIYIRSMASRGKLGGLSYAAFDAIDILCSAGFKNIIIESVGIGQQEIDLKSCADILVLVLSPESGDFIQAMKAGIIEVADIIAVNKCEREGSSIIVRDLEEILGLKKTFMPVLMVSAVKNEGIDKMVEEIKKILAKKKDKREMVKKNIRRRIYNFIEKYIWQKISGSDVLAEHIEKVVDSIINEKVNNLNNIDNLLALLKTEVI